MELQITQEVKEKIAAKRQTGDRIFLDFEDGDGPFAATGITCRLDLSFRLLLVAQDYPEEGLAVYDDTIETAIGAIRLKKSSEKYLEAETILAYNPTYNNIQLKGKSGVLADNVPIIRYDRQMAGGGKWGD